MNVLSLFDGISCGQLALKKLGIEIKNYYSSEVNKNAIKVTQTNFPNTIQLGNITDLQTSKLPKIDLLLAGSPCQGFSANGNRTQFSHPQSCLIFYFFALLYKIKPVYFLLENTPMTKSSLEYITSTLNTQPRVLNSAMVSAQQRKRLYWTNIPEVGALSPLNYTLDSILDNNVNDTYSIKNKYYNKLHSKHKVGNEFFEIGSPRIDLMRALFNKNITNYTYKVEKANVICKIEQDTPSGISRQLDRLYSTKGKSPTLTATQGNIFICPTNKFKDTRIMTRNEHEKLQTVPVNYTQEVKESIAKNLLGNGWTVDMVVHLLQGMGK